MFGSCVVAHPMTNPDFFNDYFFVINKFNKLYKNKRIEGAIIRDYMTCMLGLKFDN